MNSYPTFLLHGFMGWGQFDGANKRFPYFGFSKDKDLVPHLRECGYEVYAPSLSPFQSAWDRACELWAVINGGTVDYGKVHSEKYGHKRYGRTYEGLLKDWGKTGNHEKINIVGHSFGGPTVIAFSNILVNGVQEEIDGTPAEELSEFFKGGHANMLHTVTTLSGVNNGTTFASWLRKPGVKIISTICLAIVTMLGNTPFANFYDFNMEQWGMMDSPEEIKRSWAHIRLPFAKWSCIKNFNKNLLLDSIGHEMKLEAMAEINKNTKVASTIYYFARRADRTVEVPGKPYRKMAKDTNFISKVPAPLCCKWGSKNLEKNYGWNLAEWTYNDGLVNLPGESAPFTAPQEDADFNADFKPGIWYNLPVEYKDHLSWMGMGEDRDTYFKYFEDMLDKFKTLTVY